MAPNLEQRLNAIERRLEMGQPPLSVLLIRGTMPGPIARARADSHRWRRNENESLDDFCERVATEARQYGEKSVVIGGLPETRDEWLEDCLRLRDDPDFLNQLDEMALTVEQMIERVR